MPETIWHPKFDNPDFLGWTVVAAYVLAAVSCGWVAWKKASFAAGGSKIWALLAMGLLFLGINKQLNLQTFMIFMGRRAALSGGWYAQRRLVQTIFWIVFALLAFGLLGLFAGHARRFIRENHLAFVGAVVLLVFVVLRASTINHANELFGVKLKDEHWAWILEICGSAFIAAAAMNAAKTEPQP